MKKVLLIMLLMGGTVLTTYAQRGYDRGDHDRGRGHGHGRWERGDDDDDRCEHRERRHWDRDRDCRRGWDDDCYRPRRRVVYAEPAYYPVPVPAPVYYPSRPRAVFHAGVTIVN
ncbi:hypothetical protein CLV51_104246 [Chitinophaga niastensis]|uniref:PXPV repeat-containing protein n=1 Tax=Chitinophaga niastensis TaxID=536980 RepID=A0A2P8HH53_CHINA|nr:hypothetical protein [Chitinophaga niastensis]PSL45541.1 hypothetical protein CLV51_104246 [Chitinophaga niastensis]